MEFGAQAPFAGILVPHWIWDKTDAELNQATDFEIALDKCTEERAKMQRSELNEVYWFGAGGLLATILILSIKK